MTSQTQPSLAPSGLSYAEPQAPRASRAALWTGRILSALPIPLLLMSAVMKFIRPPQVVEGFAHLGLPERLAVPLGVLELICTALYIIPQTSVLGAILLTGYLGGALCTHLRVGDPFIMPAVIGMVLWFGLYLRDTRLRTLVPIRMGI